MASREFTEIFERSLVSESGSSSFTESELSEDDDNEEQVKRDKWLANCNRQ